MRHYWGFVTLLAACTSTPEATTVERTVVTSGFDRETLELTHEMVALGTEIDATPDRVYQAMLGAYAAFELPLQTSDPRAGIATFRVQSNRLRIGGKRASEFVDCGTGPAGARADSYRITLTAASYVERVHDTRSRLRTVVTASARDTGTSSTELRCTTTGQLEKTIASNVAIRLSR